MNVWFAGVGDIFILLRALATDAETITFPSSLIGMRLAGPSLTVVPGPLESGPRNPYWAPEDRGCPGFADSDLDAGDLRVVEPVKHQQMAALIGHHGHSEMAAVTFGLRGRCDLLGYISK
jgi:hypothetical protein